MSIRLCLGNDDGGEMQPSHSTWPTYLDGAEELQIDDDGHTHTHTRARARARTQTHTHTHRRARAHTHTDTHTPTYFNQLD
jgi:hypothetical protein